MQARHPLIAFFAGAVPVLAGMIALRPTEPVRFDPPTVLRMPEAPRWIALVGGAEPASTQISLAQDAELVREVLGEDGALFFGGGSGTFVQVRDDSHPSAGSSADARHQSAGSAADARHQSAGSAADARHQSAGSAADARHPSATSLRLRLADLFDPRDRAVRYVPGPRADGPATPAVFFAAFDALRGSDEPWTFVLAGHGEGGETPLDSVFHLWGGEMLAVSDLAEELDALARPTRLVVTSCFGGGFAEVVFTAGSSERGVAEPLRCGVFATSFDREASGCDPDPMRAAQESYAIHFWHALRGEDRAGNPLAVELDDDGTIGLLEAHTQARIASRSLDVPTTTSERFLAHTADLLELPDVPADPELPELRAEARVVRELGAALDAQNEAEARRRLERAEHVLENEEVALSEVEARADDAFYALRIRVLERLPIADDPWHPELDAALLADRDGLLALLTESPEGIEHAAATEALVAAQARVDEARVESAVRWRLLQAWEAIALASALRAHGGPSWETFRALRACEMGR